VTTALTVQVRKELRELLPWWAAIVAGMIACWALQLLPDTQFAPNGRASTPPESVVFGLFAYTAGAIVLGALSLGQEYSHGTLPGLLVHPVSRARLLLTKFAVLVPMLVALATLATLTFASDPWFGTEKGGRLLMLCALPLVCGLCLAPWMTMVCGGPMAGAVFGAALPSLLWAVGSYLHVPFGNLWQATLALAGVGAVMTWRAFMKLEVTGGSQAELDFSIAWLGRSTADAERAHAVHPLWALVKKELRLQQVTFVVSGGYVAVWLAILVGRRLAPEVFSESALFVTAGIHVGLVPVMIGALASAEERRFGTADWQTLLPFAAWKQWIIKAGIVVALALTLAWVLPALLEMIAAEPGVRDRSFPAIAVLLLCAAALYVSSLSTSGVRAFLASFPVIAGAMLLAGVATVPLVARAPRAAVRWLAQALQPVLQATLGPIDQKSEFWGRMYIRMYDTFEGAWVGFALLLVVFAFTNHRSVDRSRRRVVRQVMWLGVYAVGAVFFLSVVTETIGLALSVK